GASGQPSTSANREGSCWVEGRFQHDHPRYERRATTYCAIDSSGGVKICASRSAVVASPTSDIARFVAPSTPSNAGYVLLRSAASRPAVLPSSSVVAVTSSTSSMI